MRPWKGRRLAPIIRLFGLAFASCTMAATAADREPLPVPSSRASMSMSFAPVVEKTAPAVVNIYARKVVRSQAPAAALDGSAFWRLFRDTLLFGYGRERFENSLGSGVIVTSDGIIVTNHHVIESAQGILIALADGRTLPGFVVLSDKKTDIAILRVAAFGGSLPTIEFGNSEDLKVGDLVVAIGNPFGIGQTVTSGIVSALARTAVGVTDFRFFIQTDAAINPGNSGGALISVDGKLVGINTAIHSRSLGAEGLGFAVPSNMVRTIVESAVEGRPLLRPWIGISGKKLPSGWSALLGIPQSGAAVITAVFPGGPADLAGLQVGDIIVSMNGSAIVDFQSLRYRIAMQVVGDVAELKTLRRGVRRSVDVRLVTPPAEPARNDQWAPNLSPFSGAKVASLSPALAEELGLDSANTGVLVLDVRSGSSAAQAGLRAGDIVRSFNSEDVRTVEAFAALRLPQFAPWRMHITRAGAEISIGHR